MKPASHFTVHSIYYACVSGALLILSLLVEKGKDVLWINGHYTWLTDSLFSMITMLGNGVIFVPIVLSMVFIRFHYAIISSGIALTHGLIVSLFKEIIFPGMVRPKNFLDHDLLHFIPNIEVYGYNTFPSGHTATAFSAALFITLIARSWNVGLAALTVAIAVGYSRVYLLQHFLADVAAGALIGVCSTCIIWQLAKIFKKPAWIDFRVEVKIKRISLSEQSQMPNKETV